jgi:hypothetical protein
MDSVGFERDALIRAADVRTAGEDPRLLRDAARRGELVRVRRGSYCLPERWNRLDGRERHLLHVRAVLADHRGSGIVAGRSAGAVWELPLGAVWPDAVRLLVPRRPGGSSDADVRRSFIGAERASPVSLDGIRVTTLERAAADIARTSDFVDAVVVLDAARSRRRTAPVAFAGLHREAAESRSERGWRMLDRALAFSTDLSESPGETRTRVVIHRLGFAPPVLQVRFVDEYGEMFPDFFWPDADVALEFDGKVKYTRGELAGDDPSEVVWREKLREDRLRRLVRRVERATFADISHPARLERILLAAGVPRARAPFTRG